MSHKLKLSSLVSSLALIAGASLLAVSCGDDGSGGPVDCTVIGARVEALSVSADALTALAADIKVDVVAACAAISGDTPPGAMPTDAQLTTLCQNAKARLDAALNAEVSITIIPPSCTVNAQAQLNCEASCQAEADLTCDPGSVEVRCDPGELSVQCEGTCKVGATCEGDVNVAAACEGECSGVCTGECSGTCNGECTGTCTARNAAGDCTGTCTGTCEGDCSATCEGTCRGSCEITATGGVMCTGEARCQGGCEGTFREPKCEGALQPPSCEGSASVDCNADCEASASLDAECTPAAVEIVGNIDAALAATLRAQLPVLLQVAEKGIIAGEAAAGLVADLGSVSVDAAGCALEVGAGIVGDFTAAAQASVAASASVSVSFRASLDVSASASGG